MGAKTLIKRAVVTPLSLVGAFSAARSLTRSRDVILCYHRVLEDISRCQPGMAVTPQTFRRQLEWLGRRFDIVDLADLVRGMLTGEAAPRPRAVVTFDDGWIDNYTIAFPVLRELGVSATIFLATDVIDGRIPYWNGRAERALVRIHERVDDLLTAFPDEKMPPEASFLMGMLAVKPPLPRLLSGAVERIKVLEPARLEAVLDFLDVLAGPGAGGERDVMDWDEVRTLFDAGIAFGSHSSSHRLMPALSAEECRHELTDSRERLTAELGVMPLAFAYPNGDHDEAVVRQARKAGYFCAVTVERSFVRPGTDVLTLPRFTMHEGSATTDAMMDYLFSGLLG